MNYGFLKFEGFVYEEKEDVWVSQNDDFILKITNDFVQNSDIDTFLDVLLSILLVKESASLVKN